MLTAADPARARRTADALRRIMAQLDVGQSWCLPSGAVVRRDHLAVWSFVHADGAIYLTGTIGQLVGHALRQRLEASR